MILPPHSRRKKFFFLGGNAMAARPLCAPALVTPKTNRRRTAVRPRRPRARPRPQREHIRASLTARKHTRQPRSSLTCSADRMLAPWAADDPVGRAARPPHTIRHAHDHPQHAAAHRAALPAKAAPHSYTNRRTTEHSAQHTPARAQQRRRTRVSNTHTRTARSRRTPAQRYTQSTLPISSSRPATMHTMRAQPQCARTHSPLPAHALGVAMSNQASQS